VKAIIVDYGAGNLRSVARAVEHCGCSCDITDHPAALADAEAVIVPGVGAAADTMRNLREGGFVDPLRRFIASKRPFLGVCMGLQALMTYSEEGGRHECLDVLPGRVTRFPEGMRVPQMGWNQVWQKKPHPVMRDIADGAYFYFVHSYYVEPEDLESIAATTDYGVLFPSLVVKDNVVATQFHPEKSGANGLRFYANFLRLAEGRAAANGR
jgi:imidazole glycerol-phosphate synthase subunit HisH